MATAKDKDGDVLYRQNADGSHSIGVQIEGEFVPFSTQDGAYVAGRVVSAREAAGPKNVGSGEGEES